MSVHKHTLALTLTLCALLGAPAHGVANVADTLIAEQEMLSAGLKEEMRALERRSALLVFFIGPNYERLAAMRDAMVVSENGIAVLKQALERSPTAMQPELAANIAEFEHAVEEMRTFVGAQEGRFSLFGWLARLVQ